MDQAGPGMEQLQPRAPMPDLAEGPDTQAILDRSLELFQLAGIEVKKPQCERRLPRHHMHNQLATRPIRDLGPQHFPLDEDRRIKGSLIRRRQGGFVLVAHRQMQDEVQPRPDAELFELFCKPRRSLPSGLRSFHPAKRIASISTSAPRGRLATPIATRAGYGSRR